MDYERYGVGGGVKISSLWHTARQPIRPLTERDRVCLQPTSTTLSFSVDKDELSVYRRPCTRHGSCCRTTPQADKHEYVLILRDVTDGSEWIDIFAADVLPLKYELESRTCPTYEAMLYKCMPLTVTGDAGLRVINTTAAAAVAAAAPVDIEDQLARMTLDSGCKHQLAVTVGRSTYHQATVNWSSSSVRRPDRWQVMVTRAADKDTYFPTAASCVFHVDGRKTSLDLPLQLTAGAEYTVCVRALQKHPSEPFYTVIDVGATQLIAELTLGDLQQLYSRAVRFGGRSTFAECKWLYRNRWKAYFREIFQKHAGLMKVYVKDNSGDQASPINGKIDGLFFMAQNVNGLPPPDSPFGQIRVQVPAEVLLEKASNIYFADFYCMHGRIHYVTLVMTRPGSEADTFCRPRLLQLDLDDSASNPFLFRIGGQLYVNSANYLQVELFNTENVDIPDLVHYRGAKYLTNIPTIGKGRSTVGGIPKNSMCPQCNLPTAAGGLFRL